MSIALNGGGGDIGPSIVWDGLVYRYVTILLLQEISFTYAQYETELRNGYF